MEQIGLGELNDGDDRQVDSVLSAKQSKLLSQLEVEVGIELGKISLSAATLIDWAIGERVSLSLHSEDSVMLLIGGEKIARAHLVSQDNELFLEVAEIYGETVDGK